MVYETTTKLARDVITAVKRMFGDESEVQLSSSDAIRWINDGQREIVVTNTTINAATAITDIVANKQTYPLQDDPAFADLMLIESIDVGGYPLQNLTFQEARKYIRDNQRPGKAEIWYERAGVINLFPVPSEDITDGLVINYTKAPKLVTTADDKLSIPDNYFNALVQYVLAQTYEMDEDMAMSQAKVAQFEKSLNMQANRTTPQQDSFPTITLELEDLY